MPKVKVTGGKRLEQFIADTRHKAAQVDGTVVEIGFVDDRIAPLAAMHEFGNTKAKLPERPAFRVALPSVRAAMLDYLRDHKDPMSMDAIRGMAIVGRDALRAGYHDFHGKP